MYLIYFLDSDLFWRIQLMILSQGYKFFLFFEYHKSLDPAFEFYVRVVEFTKVIF